MLYPWSLDLFSDNNASVSVQKAVFDFEISAGSSVCEEMIEDNKHGYAFNFTNSSGSILLAAETENERLEWIRSLQIAIQSSDRYLRGYLLLLPESYSIAVADRKSETVAVKKYLIASKDAVTVYPDRLSSSTVERSFPLNERVSLDFSDKNKILSLVAFPASLHASRLSFQFFGGNSSDMYLIWKDFLSTVVKVNYEMGNPKEEDDVSVLSGSECSSHSFGVSLSESDLQKGTDVATKANNYSSGADFKESDESKGIAVDEINTQKSGQNTDESISGAAHGQSSFVSMNHFEDGPVSDDTRTSLSSTKSAPVYKANNAQPVRKSDSVIKFLISPASVSQSDANDQKIIAQVYSGTDGFLMETRKLLEESTKRLSEIKNKKKLLSSSKGTVSESDAQSLEKLRSLVFSKLSNPESNSSAYKQLEAEKQGILGLLERMKSVEDEAILRIQEQEERALETIQREAMECERFYSNAESILRKMAMENEQEFTRRLDLLDRAKLLLEKQQRENESQFRLKLNTLATLAKDLSASHKKVQSRRKDMLKSRYQLDLSLQEFYLCSNLNYSFLKGNKGKQS